MTPKAAIDDLAFFEAGDTEIESNASVDTKENQAEVDEAPKGKRGGCRLLFGRNQTIEIDQSSPAINVERAEDDGQNSDDKKPKSILRKTCRRFSLLGVTEAQRSASMPQLPARRGSILGRRGSMTGAEDMAPQTQRRGSFLGTTVASIAMPRRPNRRGSVSQDDEEATHGVEGRTSRRGSLLGASEAIRSTLNAFMPSRRASNDNPSMNSPAIPVM